MSTTLTQPAESARSEALPRRLPRSNAPKSRQTLAGYVLNLAFRLGITPSDLMKRTGLASKGRTHVLQLTFGMRLPREVLVPFAHTTGLAEDEAIGLTMESLASLTVIPRISKARDDRQWIDLRTSRYCPACLTDDSDLAQPNWRLDWLTPWAVACTLHGCELLDACPTCDTRVGETAGQLRSLIPHVMVPVTHPAACRAKPANAKSLPLCGTRLDQTAAAPAHPRLLEVQHDLDDILDDDKPTHLTSLGAPVTGRQYLRDVRLLMILMQMASDTAAVESVPGTYKTAAEQLIASRAETFGQLTRSGRTVTLPPDRHQSSAGLLIAATDLLANSGGADQINELAARATANEKNNWPTAQATSEPSTALWAALTSKRLHTTDPAKLTTHTVGQAFSFGPEHIPAYLPADLYRRHFTDTAANHERRIRRHVPIALARLVGDFPTAQEAGHFLGYSDHAIQSATGRMAQVFPDHGVDELRARVANIASDLDAAPLTDFHTPRTEINADWLLPDDAWAELRRSLTGGGLSRKNVNWDKRRRLYTVWTWSILTGGDVNVAPMVIRERKHPDQAHGTVAQLRELRRRSAPRHFDIVEQVAEHLRTKF
ncbi:TniQ family protein [Nocardioides conyzicola]|uniref:TniQ domain-containing protein n=1 Tax=Nocardioides conyzicola TaxID=1651781 RepID=A0ABP8XCQ7_9ACTN